MYVNQRRTGFGRQAALDVEVLRAGNFFIEENRGNALFGKGKFQLHRSVGCGFLCINEAFGKD